MKVVIRVVLLHFAALILLPGSAFPVRATETFHSCVGFIDSLPASISTQGVWCLRRDLSTAINDGMAISIATNNVTIDCNGFKIGGLAAGNASMARGIYSGPMSSNVSVRNCNVRGFHTAIDLTSGFGHLVEDNRLDNNLVRGISVQGENSLVRRNRVYDTGGYPDATGAVAIIGRASVIDNIVAYVYATHPDAIVAGIYVTGHNAPTVRGNEVVRVFGGSNGTAVGIQAAFYGGIRISDNHVVNTPFGPPSAGTGIASNEYNFCIGNTVRGFVNAIADCGAGVNYTQ